MKKMYKVWAIWQICEAIILLAAGVLTIIFYRLYMHKNPQNINSDGTRSNGMNIWIWSVWTFIEPLIYKIGIR